MLSYCLLHVDVACFTDIGFCLVFQRFHSITFKFYWDDIYVKHRTSMMIGISPELELALYTLCFRARPNEDCYVTLGGEKFLIRTTTYDKKLRNAHFRFLPSV